jgi:hypothetical protein
VGVYEQNLGGRVLYLVKWGVTKQHLSIVAKNIQQFLFKNLELI